LRFLVPDIKKLDYLIMVKKEINDAQYLEILEEISNLFQEIDRRYENIK